MQNVTRDTQNYHGCLTKYLHPHGLTFDAFLVGSRPCAEVR
jgi:hypothetical protein